MDLKEQLKRAFAEIDRLKKENEQLRDRLRLTKKSPIQVVNNSIENPGNVVTKQSHSKEKIRLYKSLFKGRSEVYAVRWESKAGKSGYSPACANEWHQTLCQKPKIKCSECLNRKLLPMTDQVIYDHLSGKQTIGIYPLLKDETC